jgi:AcrR family transcriptional regulator
MTAAEHLFAEKGYGPITLREIGARAGIHHSSVYHHVPGGKEELFVEVMERILERHRVGLTESLNHAAPSVREQLYAAADWLLSQPPMDLVRMEYVDSPAISPQNAQHLSDTAYTSLQVPLEAVLVEAQRRGEIAYDDFSLVSGGLIGMIESLFAVSEQTAGKSRRVMAHRLIDLLLDGLRAGRQEGGS